MCVWEWCRHEAGGLRASAVICELMLALWQRGMDLTRFDLNGHNHTSHVDHTLADHEITGVDTSLIHASNYVGPHVKATGGNCLLGPRVTNLSQSDATIRGIV